MDPPKVPGVDTPMSSAGDSLNHDFRLAFIVFLVLFGVFSCLLLISALMCKPRSPPIPL
jgi:hypothetical protein